MTIDRVSRGRAVERIWLRHYPEGVPAEIDADEWPSLCALIATHCECYATSPAFSNAGHTLTYGEFERLARAFAAYLQSQPGMTRGARVALMLPNLLHYPVAMYGVLLAGGVVVNVNPLYSPRELRSQLRDAGAEIIVVFSGVSATLADVIPETDVRHVIVAATGDPRGGAGLPAGTDPRLVDAVPFGAVLDRGAGLDLVPVPLTGADLAFLQYTGGTTGLSKGAMLTHRNMVANTAQTYGGFHQRLSPGREIFITALPLYHIFALTANCLLCIRTGGHNVLITNPRDMPGFVGELEHWKFTYISGVNTLLNGLLNSPGFAVLDFSALHTTIAGGMALQRSVAERWEQVTGCVATEGYGLSETSPVLATNPVTTTRFTGTVGVAVPSTDLSVRDENGDELPVGTAGELCARGPQVMPGYWNREEESRNAFTADGYFRTGDIAVMDERGYVRIVDRKKDMIIVSGFNVFPNEVEDVVASLEGVLECACIGVPDERTGEAVMLFVAPKPGAKLDEAAVRKWCETGLARYKVPGRIRFVDAVPKSNVGKILRRELRVLAAAESAPGTRETADSTGR